MDSDNFQEAEQAFKLLPPSLRITTLSPAYTVKDSLRDPQLIPDFFVFRKSGAVFLHCIDRAHIKNTPMFDAQSAYGYGGPLASSEDVDFLQAAHRAYREWSREKNIVLEFVRFHPLARNWRFYGGPARLLRKTVAVSLEQPDLLASYSKRCRSAIRKAQKLGLGARWVPAAHFLDFFPQMYRQAMETLNAKAEYYFREPYFQGMMELPQAQGLLCENQGTVVAGALFFSSPEIWEYHLAASTSEGRESSAANLLIHEAAIRAKDSGAKWLYLGGGTTSEENDPLYFFKSGFSEQRLEYRIGSFVHNETAYSELIKSYEADFVGNPGKVMFYR